MKRSVCVLLLVLGGCGVPLDGLTESKSEAYRECKEFGWDNDFIDSVFITMELDKRDGFSESHMVHSTIVGCRETYSDFQACNNCMLAVIDATY